MAFEEEQPEYKGPPYSEPYYEYMDESVSLMDLSCLCMMALSVQSLSGFILLIYGSIILFTVIALVSFGLTIANPILLIGVLGLLPIGFLQFLVTYRLFKKHQGAITTAIILNILAIISVVVIVLNLSIIDTFFAIVMGANLLSPILFQLHEVKIVFAGSAY